MAVTECRVAGIRPIMVTGDHKLTGPTIARSLDIAPEGNEMRRSPVPRGRPLLDGPMLWRVALLTPIAVASSVLWFEEARKLAVRWRRASSLVIGNL